MNTLIELDRSVRQSKVKGDGTARQIIGTGLRLLGHFCRGDAGGRDQLSGEGGGEQFLRVPPSRRQATSTTSASQDPLCCPSHGIGDAELLSLLFQYCQRCGGKTLITSTPSPFPSSTCSPLPQRTLCA